MITRTRVLATTFFFVSLFAPVVTFAATLRVAPASNSYEVGDTFTMSVRVASTDMAMNAASGVVHFPTDLLSVVALSKSDSVMSLWVQEPRFSNDAGAVNFEGVVLNPGYTGSDGAVINITFRARTIGTATISIEGGSVLANDGNGTELLTRATPASITITPASAPKAQVPVPASRAPKGTPTPASPHEATPLPPTLNGVHDITTQDSFEISGTTDPGDLAVEVALVDSVGHISYQTTRSNALGNFAISWGQTLGVGTYIFTARTQSTLGVYSSSTPQAPLVVSHSFSERVGAFVVGNILLILLILLLLILVPLFEERRRLTHNVDTLHDIIHKQFAALKEALMTEMQTLEKVQTKRKLTLEEARLIKRIAKTIDSFETEIEQDLKKL